MKKAILSAAVLAMAALNTQAEEREKTIISMSGSVQSDMMIAPQTDNAIGAYADSYDNDKFLTNTYVDLLGQSKMVDFGARLEFNRFPMPGFNDTNNDFKGYVVPNAWAKLKLKKTDITLGTFYEQFGSGFVLRSYQERTLGVDNSILGARVSARPVAGVNFKVLSGVQRAYWEWYNDALTTGADIELAVDEWITSWQENDTHLTIGGSWVNKSENDDEVVMADPQHKLKLPQYTNAFDVRMQLQKGGFNALAEYAQKDADPNTLNNYTYGKGSAAMLSLTYGKSGLSLLAQAKRSENMGFRNRRSANALCTAYYMNHLPAFTLDHTYSLAALYPYATQVEGEWAFQGAVGYTFKRKTALGGKFGTKVKLNYSLVRGLEHNNEKGLRGTDGIDNAWFKMGDVYYQDLNFNIEKKLTKEFDFHLMYMYQQYNKGVVQSEGGNIYSNIFIGEGKYKFNKKYTLRGEAQYLSTKHESGDWYFGLLELSVAPYLMFTVSDQVGKTEPAPGEYGKRTHYFTGAVTANWHSHRLMLTYGRTRAGYNCTGGVCRYVPASKGLTVNYNYNF